MMQSVGRLVVFLILFVGVFSTSAVLAKSKVGQPFHLSFKQTMKKAQAGDPDAEYALGYMYYYGQGAPRDDVTGQSWIQKAAFQRQPQAIQAMKLLVQAAPARRGRTTQVNKQGSPASATGSKKPSTGTTKYALPERNLLGKPADRYTLQLMGASDAHAAQNFINRNHLSPVARVYHTYLRGDKNHEWNVVVYGDYATVPQAKAAIKRLSTAVQRQKPWVKRFAVVQKEIRVRQPTLGGLS